MRLQFPSLLRHPDWSSYPAPGVAPELRRHFDEEAVQVLPALVAQPKPLWPRKENP